MTNKPNAQQNQIDAIESLNQQIIDNDVPNAQPYPIEELMRAANDAGNSNIYKLVKQSQEQAKNPIPATIGVNNLDEIYKIIESNAGAINFDAYIDALGGNHERYIKDGKSKIPQSIIAVVVSDYLINLTSQIGYKLAQLYSNDIEVKAGYLFNGKYWQPFNEGFIRNLLRDILVKMGYDPLEAQTVRLLNTLVQTFWTKAPKCPSRDNNQILINLDNGTLEISPDGSVKQRKFSQCDYMLYCLPYAYDAKALSPLFTEYLNRVLPDKESQNILQELMGSVFIKNINLEKIGILYGSGANGKSVLMKIIITLLGNSNVSQMDLKALTTDRNADNNRAQLMGKLLNFAPEINAKGEQAHDLIKRMASGEAIQVKILYKDTITISDYAKLIFNANMLPSDVELSHGFFRRFLIVEFDQTISDKEKDPELANNIIANELPAVLNWMIEGAKRLQQNKKFSMCKKSDDLLNRYRLESDVVAMWIEERGYIPHEFLTKLLKDLTPDLRDFAMSGGYKSPSDKTIAERMRNLGFKTEKPKGYPTRIYITNHININKN
jgi:putative DNA primase/helicase